MGGSICNIQLISMLVILQQFYVFSLPLQIGVALCLLYTQVNYAFLSGFALTVLLIPGDGVSK